MSRAALSRAATLLGLLLVAACVWFVGRRLAEEWDAAEASLRRAEPAWLALGVLLAALAMTSMALGWQRVLGALGAPVGTAAAVAWYYVGEIGKYLPGSLWPVVGRAELARRGGVGRGVAYQSVALSLLLLYLASAVVGGAVAEPLVVVPFAVAAVAVLHPAVGNAGLRLARRVTGASLYLTLPSLRTSLLLAAGYVPTWLLVGTATWAIARALDPGAAWSDVVPAAAASWLVGFLAIPVPGGVGVREAVFVAAVGSLPAGVAAATAVVARLVFVAVDAAGAAVLSPRARR
jgi:uncharacterized membrane protein YbhN (UPF0104 family)